MFDISTREVRLFLAEVWRKRFSLHLQPIEVMTLKIINAHPEYHYILENIDNYLDKNWSALSGDSNPFLHLSLHLSLQEQVSIDQPPGIATIHQKLYDRYGNWLDAEHKMMDALLELLNHVQLHGKDFDINMYLDRLRQLID